MENSFFILSDRILTIERFHICTWDFKQRDSFIELGFEIDNSESLLEIELTFAAPFIKEIEESQIICLCNTLKKRENSRFIFNDSILGSKPLNNRQNQDDDRFGTILQFRSRGDLTLLPIKNKEVDQQNGSLVLKIKPPAGASQNIYFRVLIELPYQTISISKRSFSKSMYIFDLKVNELRNLSDEVFNLMEEKSLCLSKVKSCFCFHMIPDTYEISFVDDKKLINIRELEYSAFIKYLPDTIKGLKNEEHMIIFNKDSKKDSYTFFSIFNKEILGTKQIIFTLAANIICSWFFVISRPERYIDSKLSDIPVYIWFFCFIFVIFLAYFGYLLIPPIYRWSKGCIKSRIKK